MTDPRLVTSRLDPQRIPAVREAERNAHQHLYDEIDALRRELTRVQLERDQLHQRLLEIQKATPMPVQAREHLVPGA